MHAKLNEFKVELDARMNAVANNRTNNGSHSARSVNPTSNNENAPSSARVQSNGTGLTGHQYCGPYKLEKTLGKGQTGELNK